MPVPHSGFAGVEAVIADASGRIALSKPKLVENPFDGVLFSLASLDGCNVIATIPQRLSIGRDKASPLDFILRTNHAFLA